MLNLSKWDEGTPHPDPELGTLLSWVGTRGTTISLPPQPLDWQGLVKQAHTLGLAPLLYKKLDSVPWLAAIPEEPLRVLRDAYFTSAARNIILQSELEAIADRLAQAGIRVMVLKGAALANSLYGNIALRPMSDLDLLVRPDDVKRAIDILENFDYVLVGTEADRLDPFAPSFTGELVFSKDSPVRATVELHWQLIPAVTFRKATRLDTDKLWKHTAPLTIGMHEALQLTPEATLVHLCTHLGVHSFRHLRGLLDVALLARELDAAQWERFAGLAEVCQVRTVTYVALTLAQRIFQAEMPPAVIKRLEPSKVRRSLIFRLLRLDNLLHLTDEPGLTTGQAYLLRFLLSDSVANSLKMLCWLWLPDRAWLQSRYGNRHRSLWRMRFTHIVQLLSSAVRYSLSRRWTSPARW